ncbi:NupC/NupG family nucleoside CNT transporter [Roseomonas sp. CCTCC AB2023176]|uniref:NupC/NupG family nucleoside CNT transporter n=1 Tax=Roseomonas sp. CCTCC AB2023176 TaxID=3342640 RepID=UPI0035D7679A
MNMLQFQSAFGLLAFTFLAWACGGFRRPVPWRAVVAGLVLQVVLAAAMLHVPPLRAALSAVGAGVDALAAATRAGTTFVFGYLGGGPSPFDVARPEAGFILFFQGLPLVLVVGAISAVLYHWRVLPLLVRGMSRVLRAAFGLSGATGVSVAANVFVGMVEAVLFIRGWFGRLSRGEMLVVMTAGLATISGNVLVLYATFLAPVVPDAAGQLLAASLVSAPAAILAARLMLPDEGSGGEAEADPPRLYESTMEALVRGTSDGLALLLNIAAALIVFVALVALANMILRPVTGLTLEAMVGTLFWPLAWLTGIPAEEAGAAARLLGVRAVINEFVAYLSLAGEGGAGLSPRSRIILTWALCGFANLASVGIMVSGLVTLCPERRADIVRLGFPSLVAGTIACLMTGAAVGMLVAG